MCLGVDSKYSTTKRREKGKGFFEEGGWGKIYTRKEGVGAAACIVIFASLDKKFAYAVSIDQFIGR